MRFKYNICYCSTSFSFGFSLLFRIQIQHLLLFNRYQKAAFGGIIEFKYNTCYCSTYIVRISSFAAIYSNTTPVTVQRLQCRLDFSDCGDSNTTPVTVQPIIFFFIKCPIEFKYNTCYCSTR